MINGFVVLLSSGPKGFRRYKSYILLLLLRLPTAITTFVKKKAGRQFSFLKKAGHHQKVAGCLALQKRPRQSTECDAM